MTTAAAAAQTPAYRVVRFEPSASTEPLTSLPTVSVPITFPTTAFGLSQDGIVVGSAWRDLVPIDGAGCPFTLPRAFVWQPEPLIPGVPDETMFYLEMRGNGFDEALASCGGYSYAFDINAQFDVVGDALVPGDANSSNKAFIRPFTSGLASPIANGVMNELPPADPGDSAARSISDRRPADEPGGPDRVLVSGGGVAPGLAVGPSLPLLGNVFPHARGNAALRWDLGTGTVAPLLGSAPLNAGGFSSGINEQALDPTIDEVVSGFANLSLFTSDSCLATTSYGPRRWTMTTETALGLGGLDGPYVNGAAHDTNDPGQLVGFVQRSSGPACEIRAVRWEPPTYASYDLLPLTATPNADTKAHATNNVGDVVGLDASTDRALLWPASGGVHALSNLVAASGCSIDEIVDAHDINDDGWIVAQARFVDGSDFVFLGVLLIPMGPCEEDINEDGVVDAIDLALVSTSTGACLPNRICHADVDGDCDVDQDDITLVLTRIKRGGCTGQALAPELAGLWLDAGGEHLLATDSASAADVEAAVVDGDQLSTFVNLLELLDGGS